MKKMNKKESDANAPKTIVALTLAVASIAMVIPDTVNADAPGSCTAGSRGDCEELTSSPGQMVCTEGIFWNDCY